MKVNRGSGRRRVTSILLEHSVPVPVLSVSLMIKHFREKFRSVRFAGRRYMSTQEISPRSPFRLIFAGINVISITVVRAGMTSTDGASQASRSAHCGPLHEYHQESCEKSTLLNKKQHAIGYWVKMAQWSAQIAPNVRVYGLLGPRVRA